MKKDVFIDKYPYKSQNAFILKRKLYDFVKNFSLSKNTVNHFSQIIKNNLINNQVHSKLDFKIIDGIDICL